MDSDINAVLIAEGVKDPPGETEEERIENYLKAWQSLIDSGLCWSLQGFFGRTAEALISRGHCRPAPKKEEINGHK